MQDEIQSKNKAKRGCLKLLMPCLMLLGLSIVPYKQAQACCVACAASDCDSATELIDDEHEAIYDEYEEDFDADLAAFEEWFTDHVFEGLIVPAMSDMATQMGAVAMQYTQIIGMFLDAQIQMDTQRLFRKLQFEAHRDYALSEDFCMFGTNIKSLAGTESKSRYNSLALSRLSLKRFTGERNLAGSRSVSHDYQSRWDRFVNRYCDKRDNNAQTNAPLATTVDDTGLQLACNGSSGGVSLTQLTRTNRDIDYTRLVDDPRTIDIDFTDNDLESGDLILGTIEALGVSALEPNTEEDIVALSENLYGNQNFSRSISNLAMNNEGAQRLYFNLRSVIAKRMVAQASFNAIVGLKSYGSSSQMSILVDPVGSVTTLVGDGLDVSSTTETYDDAPLLDRRQTQRYMGAIMAQLFPVNGSVSLSLGTVSLDFSGGNIFDLIGYNPSYYSQLEVLAKRIYQNPTFYANLYDSPTNNARKKVAMRAIELMVDRAIYESQLRREMSISVLLSSKLRASHRLANKSIATGKE